MKQYKIGKGKPPKVDVELTEEEKLSIKKLKEKVKPVKSGGPFYN